MKIAVAGGTGTIGRYVVDAVSARGHEVVVLTRSTGVDLTTGEGLDNALRGVDAVIDVSNKNAPTKKKAVEFFTTVTRQLQRAEQAAGVSHHVALSIVGVDGSALGYYQGKLAQERTLRAGVIPFTVLRATQFHEFAEQSLQRKIGRLVPVPRMKTQPVAAREVAEYLAELAEQPGAGHTVEMAGPEVLDLVAMCKDLVRRKWSGRAKLTVVAVFLPGRAGMAARSGGLLPTGEFRAGRQRYAQWLAEQPGQR
jgi:uncharacterized protein YbjT (DUF2867 family)